MTHKTASLNSPASIDNGIFNMFQHNHNLDFTQIVPAPQPYKNTQGQPLWGFDEKNFSAAAFHFGSMIAHGRYADALDMLPQLKITLEIETLALHLLQLVFPPILWVQYGKTTAINDPPTSPLQQLILNLYSAFTGKKQNEIEQLIDKKSDRLQKLWTQLVPDEDHPTHQQLSRYYNSLIFPEGDLLTTLADSRLSVAYRALPVILGQKIHAQKGFDYGGGSGFTTSAMAQAGFKQVCLIEENQTMLDFTQWRDRQCSIQKVAYLRESQLIARQDQHHNQYDIGICTEVLEHVLDVEETIQRLAYLIKPGGYLFLSASFGLYPHLSHLKPNLKYAGQEDILLTRAGFTPAQINLSIPMLSNARLYLRNPSPAALQTA